MFSSRLFLCVFVVAVFACSPAHAVERYLQNKAGRFNLLATTTAPATTIAPTAVVVPAAPCLAWGCSPSLNTLCLAGTTGPIGAGPAGCLVDYVKTTLNLNMAAKIDPAILTATVPQIMFVLLQLGTTNMGPSFGVFFLNDSVATSGTVMTINAHVTCIAAPTTCTAAILATEAKNLLANVPPYAFAAMGMTINSITTCMDADVNGICADNINTVVGNPPAPCTTDCGGGSSGPSIGVIIGAVVGGIVGVAALAGGYYLYKKRHSGDFSTATRNISSSQAAPSTAAVVSGPIISSGVYGGGQNFNNPSPRYGAQTQPQPAVQMQPMNLGGQAAPNPPMRNYNGGNPSPRGPQAMGGGYGQNNFNQGGYNNNNRGWN